MTPAPLQDTNAPIRPNPNLQMLFCNQCIVHRAARPPLRPWARGTRRLHRRHTAPPRATLHPYLSQFYLNGKPYSLCRCNFRAQGFKATLMSLGQWQQAMGSLDTAVQQKLAQMCQL